MSNGIPADYAGRRARVSVSLSELEDLKRASEAPDAPPPPARKEFPPPQSGAVNFGPVAAEWLQLLCRIITVKNVPRESMFMGTLSRLADNLARRGTPDVIFCLEALGVLPVDWRRIFAEAVGQFAEERKLQEGEEP